jgi:hypothetical protein
MLLTEGVKTAMKIDKEVQVSKNKYTTLSAWKQNCHIHPQYEVNFTQACGISELLPALKMMVNESQSRENIFQHNI